MTELSPLQFGSIFKDKIWGGQALASRLNKKLPSAHVGECWELSGCGDDISLVSGGALKGASLKNLWNSHKATIAGAGAVDPDFPLLYKFIDANDNLSVQVHPNDEQARSHGWGHFGKTECWFIVDARPEAKIIVGFNRAVTPHEVEEAARAGTMDSLLNTIPIAAGDMFFIPAGTVHAILDGTLIYEVQETSDTTFRLYDWGRNSPDRPLHIEESLAVLDFSSHDRNKVAPVALDISSKIRRTLRTACRYFVVEDYCFVASAEYQMTIGSAFRVMTVIAGECILTHAKKAQRIPLGSTVLIPAACGSVTIGGEAQTRFLISYPPHLMQDVIAPLRAAGVPDSSIELLGGAPRTNDLAPLLK